MGLTEQSPDGFPDISSPNPMMLDPDDEIPGFVAVCPGINPVMLEKNETKELEKIEHAMQRPEVVRVKIYAGYYPYYVHDNVYEPVNRLAGKYNLTVVIHGGATCSDRCLLKYSHPLEVDELAVKHRYLNIVIAHMGDPWVMDTAVVVSKNDNVFTDLSGLIVSDEKGIRKVRSNRYAMEHIITALVYAERYQKVLFGSDWPFAPVMPYMEFVRELIPEEYQESVANSSVILDTLAADDYILPVHAADDTHFWKGEECSSFVLTTESNFVKAIKDGNLYASRGPRMEVRRDGNTLHIECSPASSVTIQTGSVWINGRVLTGDGITSRDYAIEPNDLFARVEVVDKNGNTAWSSYYKYL